MNRKVKIVIDRIDMEMGTAEWKDYSWSGEKGWLLRFPVQDGNSRVDRALLSDEELLNFYLIVSTEND